MNQSFSFDLVEYLDSIQEIEFQAKLLNINLTIDALIKHYFRSVNVWLDLHLESVIGILTELYVSLVNS